MSWSMRSALGLAACFICVLTARAQAPPAPVKVKVEIRWVEDQYIKGLTEEKGFQTSCDPDSIMYPHLKPALVLSAAEVEEARLTEHSFGGRDNYMVALHLTKEARDRLAATCEGDEMRLLTIVVDGKYWGLYRYEKDKRKPFVPKQARAESFTPSVGFFSSKFEAQRLVNSLK